MNEVSFDPGGTFATYTDIGHIDTTK